MRFSFLSTITVALAADAAVASTWFGKAVYNKWHETELERWLSDHNVPYPTPADRKDLENLVKDNWNDLVVQPYNSWDLDQLSRYISLRGQEVKSGAEKNKDSLVAQVKSVWEETEDQASETYSNTKEWIFDTWTESQLKDFADRHGIPVPQPRNRDVLLKQVRENYQSAAKKAGETAAWPGDWIYENWSDSDLKAWLDERGFPAPQPGNRDELIKALRRNSYIAAQNSAAAAKTLSASASAATESLTDALIDSWSESQLKEFFDKNGVKVPQGSKKDELVALARKHRARLTGDNVSDKAESAYGAASTKAGNEYAQATRDAYAKGDEGWQSIMGYVDWAKDKLGLLDEEAKASLSSAASVASSSASSLSSAASKSSSSASVAASKSAEKAGDAATEAASQGKHRGQEAAQKATDAVKEEL